MCRRNLLLAVQSKSEIRITSSSESLVVNNILWCHTPEDCRMTSFPEEKFRPINVFETSGSIELYKQNTSNRRPVNLLVKV
jgi:hypothetical protein